MRRSGDEEHTYNPKKGGKNEGWKKAHKEADGKEEEGKRANFPTKAQENQRNK